MKGRRIIIDIRLYDKYIIEIAKSGNLTKAAAVLGISQQALSAGLTNLENELGYKIFYRKSAPISFTPEGEIYFDYIKRLELLTGDLEKRIQDYHNERNHKARIGGPIAYVESVVTTAISNVRKENPRYKFWVKSAPLEDLIEMATKGKINCFISTSDYIPTNFEKELIMKEKVYLCIPKENPINKQISEYEVSLGETGKCFDYSILDKQEFVFLSDKLPLQQQSEDFLKKNNVEPLCSVVVNQVSVAVRMALKGEGICFASEAALSGNVDLDGVCLYALPDTISGRNIYVAYDKELFLPKACKEFIKELSIK